jgi:serine protease Do
VVLPSGEEYRGKVIGTDPKTDLAVIKVPATSQLPYVKFGDSDKLVVGQWVVAIGHPRGLDQTVTQGIISAKHRGGITDPSSYQDFLQTDAAINPGSSGGPLLNLYGEVIGINAVIASASGGFEGIGFTIPSNIAVHVMNQLIANGKVERGWLGVSIQNVTYDLARKSGLAKTEGALVAEVTKGGPAEKAGIKKGDIILEYNGRPVPDSGFLRNDVAVTKSGAEVKLIVLRDGKRITVPVTIGSQATASKLMAASAKDRLGVEVQPVSKKEIEKFDLGDNPGVTVKSVDKRGPLGRQGIERGDILLEIDGEPVSGVDSFDYFISAIPPGKEIVITVLDHRTGNVGDINVKLK